MRFRSTRAAKRRGVATIWLLAALPVLLVTLLVLSELGHLWLARVEAENGLESAALAAVRQWGKTGGSPAAGWTTSGRNRGQTLAAADYVDGSPVILGTNLGTFNAVSNPNENLTYLPGVGPPPTGNLVFGTVIESGPSVTFDTTKAPSCGGGVVLIDASGSGNLFSGDRNDWGIAFQNAINPALRITRIDISLATASVVSRFNGNPELNTVVDTYSSAKVKDNSGTFQQDNKGFASLVNTMNAGQIVFSFPNIQTLRLTFSAGGGDDGFAPGDRFRFAQDVRNLALTAQRDGDEIGGATVTVFFNSGTSVSGIMFDNTESKNAAIDPAQVDPVTGSLIVHPALIPDLPVPPTAAGSNNGQSYVRIVGGGGSTEYFGVRAQATIRVTGLYGGYFGLPFISHVVTVDTTARYDCATDRARLVRVDQYLHP